MHEFGHFFCGHLTGGVLEWTEGKMPPGRDPALTQAMEFDADVFAARLHFAFLHSNLQGRIYQDFYGTDDIDEIFWDTGILFGGLFLGLEEINPSETVKTHPKANERLMAFLVCGIGAYEEVSSEDVSSAWSWMVNGVTNMIIAAGAIETSFGKSIAQSSETIQSKRELLKKHGFQDRRLFHFGNDWLLKEPLP